MYIFPMARRMPQFSGIVPRTCELSWRSRQQATFGNVNTFILTYHILSMVVASRRPIFNTSERLHQS